MHNPSETLSKSRHQAFWLVIAAILLPVVVVAFVMWLDSDAGSGTSSTPHDWIFLIIIAFIFGSDRIAKLPFWDRLPSILAANRKNTIYVVVFAAAFALPEDATDLSWGAGALVWAKDFPLLLVIFAAAWVAVNWVERQWAAYRARKKVK